MSARQPRRRTPRKHDLELIGLEVQLYLADKYNLSAVETTQVFCQALGDTIAYAVDPTKPVDGLLESAAALIRSHMTFRQANPPAMGLKQIIAEYRRSCAKVRPS